ncbi:MAG TPA: ABC transporter ATP-binding protein [archaeon]|nr:ABC transporter ATP-binding protein [archaeon]
MLLEVNGIDVFYGKFQALRGVSMKIDKGQVVSLIGPNGAGKTTTLRAITGQMKPAKGSVTLNGDRIDQLPAHEVAKKGIGMVPEGRQLFDGMTVYENLLMGAYTKPRNMLNDSLQFCFKVFPRLEERRKQLAGTLSGGEQQMLAIARTLMLKPTLLLIDELSLGLMPKLAYELFKVLETIRDQGITILVVEQHIRSALELSDRAYLMEEGRIVQEASAKEMLESEHIKSVYLGI